MKSLWLSLCALIVLFVCSHAFGADGALPGDGSSENPYLIEDFNDFQTFCDTPEFWDVNVFTELTHSMREKRSYLLYKLDEIKNLREKLKKMNRTGVRALERKKERLEFRISTEAITLDRERALMKEVTGLHDEIKAASKTSDNRKDVVGRIKELVGEIETLKNELDEMKLTLINLREERKKRKQMIKKKKEARAARGERGDRPRRRPEGKAPTEEEMFVSLEDIVVINKK